VARFNGAANPIVAISIEPAVRARMRGLPVALRELRVSVDDPNTVVTALKTRRTMKRKKWTPEEWRAYFAAREPSIKHLRGHVERIRVELELRRRMNPG
jgi:O-methyltransferase involved in polyketide biosynthesis